MRKSRRNKLREIGCTVAPRSHLVEPFRLHPDEIDPLAKLEHERWMHERAAAGWRYGRKRDDKRRRNPSMVAWADLPESERDKDRLTVRNIESIIEPALAEIGLQIVRLPR